MLLRYSNEGERRTPTRASQGNMSIKWNQETNEIDKPSNVICVGSCSVSNRPHFAKRNGFKATHWGYNSKEKLWWKGTCAGHPLSGGRDSSKSPKDQGNYHASPEWHEVADMKPSFVSDAKAAAARESKRLEELSKVRVLLCKKAPKKVVKAFDQAVNCGYRWRISHIRKRYGV